MTPHSSPAGEQADRLLRRGFWLEYASMAWMTAEAAVAITAGAATGSIALIGFGLDSVIEFAAACIVVWQLRGQGRETRAVRLIGVTFFLLALYLVIQSIRDLAGHARPEHSVPGLAVTTAALVVMPLLAIAKRRAGQALGNRTLIADSAETAFCAFTSAAALLGTGLNAWLGWWWADPAAMRCRPPRPCGGRCSRCIPRVSAAGRVACGSQVLQSAWVGDRRAARMAGSSPAAAMIKVAARPPAQAPGGMMMASPWA
jgi:hypothetical protein